MKLCLSQEIREERKNVFRLAPKLPPNLATVHNAFGPFFGTGVKPTRAQISLTAHLAGPFSKISEERFRCCGVLLAKTSVLAREDQLPDAELNSAGLKISHLENSVPKERRCPLGCPQ